MIFGALLGGLGKLLGPLLAALGRVPPWVWLLAAALWWGWAGHQDAREARAELATHAQEAERAAALTQAEQRRLKIETEGNARELQTQIALARSRGAADGLVADQLRLALQALRSGRAVPGTAAPALPGEAADRAGDVAQQCVERLKQLAAATRDGLARARACERHADAVSAPRD